MHQGYGQSGGLDLAQLQATMHAIELACTSIQMHVNPAAAEATILSLCQFPRPYQACQFILENSQVANARFQAAAAIRDSAIREWGFLTADDKRSLISFCLRFVMQHASSPEGYVQAKVSSVAAQLLKRGWLDFSAGEKEAFLYEVKQAVIGSHGLDTQFSGVNFLESLVSEFSPSTSTAMGLPREFHEQCRTSLELDYLKAFYCWAQDAALRVTNRIIGSNSAVPKVRVCSAALRLMLQILNWDFRYNTNAEGAKKSIDVFSTGVGQDSNSPKRSDYSLEQVPQAIQNHMMESRETEHPVVVLSSLVIKFAEQSLDPEMRASFFGPRLMEAVIWFLARWSCTYLMPSEESGDKARSSENDYEPQLQPHHPKGKLLGFFGEDNQGKAMLDIIVRISTTTLVSYPGEKDLQELACHQLFHGLVRRRNVCAHLVALDSWRCLANTFANDRSLFSLNATHQRSLAQSLVLSASGMTTSEASNQYVRDLMGHMTAYLVELSGKNDLKDVAQQPGVILLVTCLLERLRGGASASEPRTQKAIYEMGFTAMNPVLIFLEVYKHESAVVYLLLKFVVDWVDAQIIYLEAEETIVVINFCMRLLQLYSSHNIGRMSLSLSSSLLSEANTEKYKDLRALLQLLSNLCTKDLIPLRLMAQTYLRHVQVVFCFNETFTHRQPHFCEQDLYQRLGNELIERQGNPAFRSRLVNALQLLTSSNDVSSKLDRPNYQKFRKNLQSFLLEVRGFLRTI